MSIPTHTVKGNINIPAVLKSFNQAKELCMKALRTDGGHHKQWYIEKVLEQLGFNLKGIARVISDIEAKKEGATDLDKYWKENYAGFYPWERGVPP